MNVGLIAHDSKKKLMQNFCIAYKGILSKHNLYATGTTGKLIEEVTNLNIHKFLPGHLGGELSFQPFKRIAVTTIPFAENALIILS